MSPDWQRRKVELYRYDLDNDAHPYMQPVNYELAENADPRVLDVLAGIKRKDPSLSFRRSCREGLWVGPHEDERSQRTRVYHARLNGGKGWVQLQRFSTTFDLS